MKVNPDKVPTTVKEAVDEIIANLTEDDLKYIKSEQGSSSIHFTAGMGIRNTWSLWDPDTPIKRDAVNTYGIAHADDISGLIWEWVWAIVREKPFDPMGHVKSYHRHWRSMGTNSLEAGGWNV